MQINFSTAGVQTRERGYTLQTDYRVGRNLSSQKKNVDPQSIWYLRIMMVLRAMPSKCYPQAKSLKVYTGLLGGSGG